MKTNKLWSFMMMLVLVLGTAIAISSCDKDDDGVGSKGLNGQIWVNVYEVDYGVYEYLQFNNGTLKRCLASTEAGSNNYNWSYTPDNGGWYIAVMNTYPYTVINNTTIMSFNGQLMEINGNTMRRGDIVYKKYK